MTSEGPHHPGHEPDEVAPGAGGSAPFGGQPAAARPGGVPDLGWAPPPPPMEQRQQNGWENAPAAGHGPVGQQPGWGPGPDHGRAEQPAWDVPAEPARPVRATASVPVPGPDSRPSWDSPAPTGQPHWAGQGGPGGSGGADLPERPEVPAVEPWGPGEAWGAAAPTSGSGAPQAPASPSGPDAWAPANQANGWEPTPQPVNSPAPGGWEPTARPEDNPVYQPAPSPGFSPAGAVPLPPQEQRVPGASLAASPPGDYQSQMDYQAPAGYQPPMDHPSPTGYAPPQQRGPVDDGYPAGAGFPGGSGYPGTETDHRADGGYPAPDQRRGDTGGYPVDNGHDHQGHSVDQHWPGAEANSGGWEAESHQAPVVPQPRMSPESAGSARVAVPPADQSMGADPSASGGSVTASASVPTPNRAMPPADLAVRPTQPPQPRVYGRPSRPEPEPEEVPLPGDPGDLRPGTEHGAPAGYGYDHAPSQGNGYDQSAPHGGGYDQSGQSHSGGYDQSGQSHAGGYDPNPPHTGGYDQGTPHGGYDQQPAAASARVAPPATPIPDFSQGHAPFGDLVGTNRPVNGVKPNTPGAMGTARTGGPERFGDPDSFAEPTAQFGGGLPGYPEHAGPGRSPQDGPDATALAPAVPSPAARPVEAPGDAWGQSTEAWNPGGESEQGRFDAFKPDAEPKNEPAPAPKVRNGRVLLAVLTAAVLLLVVPLGALWLLGKIGKDGDGAAFDPAVNSCVKQSGNSAVAATCGEPGTFSIVSKVDAKEKCTDKTQPHVVLPGSGTNRVLCLKPATAAR
ncbi:hypothetical protein [Micromonospora echinofusca]|uniref:Uncharacterized protein n=1 Tax=Micromonospora echinofusca TaxID=47858 RepID=A0ABS3VMX4_MICEH|nr:hypothetical protein [Micromonospora echinofusca]MBO4205851.1 hypothetical protein [Micromonospora echinofusca]